MNINPSAMKIYQSGAVNACQHEGGVAATRSDRAARVAAGEKTDTISISREAADHQAVSRIGRSVMEDLRAEEAPGRLDAIARAVADGSYAVPAGSVADAILGGLFAE